MVISNMLQVMKSLVMISLRFYHLQGAASPLLKEMLWWKEKPEHKILQGFFRSWYFLAFNEDILDQACFSHCEEVLMMSCFPRGTSAHYWPQFRACWLAEQMLLTAPLLAAVQSQTMQSSVSYNLFIVVSTVCRAFVTHWTLCESTSYVKRTGNRQYLYKANLSMGK